LQSHPLPTTNRQRSKHRNARSTDRSGSE
jgi:hypothetical protein